MNQQEKKTMPPAGMELPELDLELTEMAEEVPPMPADFHANWMKAVREEAAKQQEPARQPAGKIVAFTKGPWFRALSAAAVFVFLIGGTMLYRAGKGTVTPSYKTEMRVAEPETNTADAGETEAMAAGETEDAAIGAPEGAGSLAAEPDAAGETAVKAEKEAPSMGISGNAVGKTTFEADANAVHKAASETLQEEAAAEAPAAETAEAPAPAPAPEQVPVPEQPPTLLQQAGSFLSDMGAFLLSVWPWLAGAAVILAACAVVRNRKRR